jgi:hypothetical protein
MTSTKPVRAIALFGLAAFSGAAGCHPTERMEDAVIRFDQVSERDAERWVVPLLSDRGKVSYIGDGRVRVIDYHRNVLRVREALARADESPFAVTLGFGLILASEHGPVDVPVLEVADALRDLVRFEGFQLIGERSLTASEGRAIEGRMVMARGTTGKGTPYGFPNSEYLLGRSDQYIVSAEVEDIRATNARPGSVELTVRLRREHGGTLFNSNVVVPIGQTVVLGRSHPDGPDQAVLLTVRPELQASLPSRVRTGARRPTPSPPPRAGAREWTPTPSHDFELQADTPASRHTPLRDSLTSGATPKATPSRARGIRPAAVPPPD